MPRRSQSARSSLTEQQEPKEWPGVLQRMRENGCEQAGWGRKQGSACRMSQAVVCSKGLGKMLKVFKQDSDF